MKLLQELRNLTEAPTIVNLSDDDKEKILADIEDWTGGLGPHEMDEDDLDNYLEYSLSSDYEVAAVRKWLATYVVGSSENYVVTDVHHNPDDISVLVYAGDNHLQPASHDYYGVNVVFIRGGHVELVTSDKMSDWQAKNDREHIIDLAEKAIRADADSEAYYKELGFI